MNKLFPTLAAAGLIAACGPSQPATPGASASPKASQAPTAASSTAASPTSSPAASAGPALPNSGTFAYASGQGPRYHRHEKGNSRGEPDDSWGRVKITDVKDGVASVEVTQSFKQESEGGKVAGGSFKLADGDPYGFFLDTNFLVNPALRASAKVQGEEAVTVPAGTFTCTKTHYYLDVATGSALDITTWVNGQAGLVKAQRSNHVTFGAAVLTEDISFELIER